MTSDYIIKSLSILVCFLQFELRAFAYSECPENTNLVFYKQSELDSFRIKYPNCKELYGITLITDGIINVDNFPKNITITNKFEIKNCSNLISFDADVISNDSRCVIKIYDNTKLQSIKGLNKLKKCSSIAIYNNPVLNDSIYFKDLEYTGDIDIYNNNSLKNLIGFDSLKSAKNIEIYSNSSLEKIYGFNNIKQINQLKVYRNDKLTRFDGFNNYGEYAKLIHFDSKELNFFNGFQNLKNAGTILFSNVNLAKINSFYDVESSSILLLSCDVLEDVNNFKRLKRAGIINVSESKKLKDLIGFDSIKIITNQLYLDRNESFESINSFNQLDSIYGLCNLWLNSYKEINGFKNLKYVEHLAIISNNNLNAINGFLNLNKARYVSIVGNNLFKLDAFSNLAICDSLLIRANSKLKDLSSFINLDTTNLKKLEVSYNTNLNICNTPPICDYLENSTKFAIVTNNAEGCATRQEIIDSCKENSVAEENEITFVYPNPVSDKLNLKGKFDKGNIIDVNGQILFSFSTAEVDCHALNPGIYFVKLYHNESFNTYRFVKI